MVTARLAARRVAAAELDDEASAYLLGATAPDVRIMTGQPRDETHFITLEADHPETSIGNLFSSHPELYGLKGRARAFTAGYLTHLEVDQTWIREVFRPYFGRHSSLTNRLEANFMDRTLQFYMDWKERQDRNLVQGFYQQVVAADLAQEAPIIPPETLQQWQTFVKRILSNEPSWEWFSDFLQKRLRSESDEVSDAELRELAAGLPDILERVLNYVTPGRLAAFKADAVERQAAALRSYLK